MTIRELEALQGARRIVLRARVACELKLADKVWRIFQYIDGQIASGLGLPEVR